MRGLATLAFAAVLAWVPPSNAAGQKTTEPAGEKRPEGVADGDEHAQHLPNLTLLNFFSAGWTESWEKRSRYTPDMALLKVTTNFLERELRLDYAHTNVSGNPKLEETDFANALIAYGLDRRFMIEVVSNYQWNEAPGGAKTNGPGNALLARFQIMDTPGQSYSFQTRVSAPNKGIGQTQTSLTYSLAGWQDMHQLLPALGRCGLYFSLQYEDLVGTSGQTAYKSDLAYDVSFAETWTQPSTPLFGNFTTFLEAYATTYFEGTSSGKTVASLTPGIRFWFAKENSLTLGVDLPTTHAPPFSSVYRATYILNF